MRILTIVIFVVLVGTFWQTSTTVMTYRLNNLVASGKIPYGPIPELEKNYYSYSGVPFAFESTLELERSEEFTKNEFQELIISSVGTQSQNNLKRYLVSTLNFSEDYQMDPFWIISVMMVESGFDKTAQSPRNARGLMQIKPDTAEHLYHLMNKKISEEQIQRNLHHPDENIEVGVFYLKKLLHNFRLNYRHATIAYNLGPNKLKALLNYDTIDTRNYSYLLKVQTRYNELSKNFSLALKKRPKPFELTYVVKGQGRKLEEQILGLFVAVRPAIDSEFLLSSENLMRFSAKSRSF